MKKKLLIISCSRLCSDPRVLRQVRALGDLFEISTCGYAATGIDDIACHLPLPDDCRERPRPSFLEKFRRLYRDSGKFIPPEGTLRSLGRRAKWLLLSFRHHDILCWPAKRLRELAGDTPGSGPFDLVIANDIDCLCLASAFARRDGAKVLLDAHEYTPEMKPATLRNKLTKRPFWNLACRYLLPDTDAMTTVNASIAARYRQFGVNPSVIPNAVAYRAMNPSPVDPGRIHLVHHGVATARRATINMIDLLDLLEERFVIHFLLLPGDGSYYRKFLALAGSRRRVFLHEPVPTEEIVPAINRFDIGIHLLPPVCYNHRVALPNKFFEFVQARLAVATWPSPEMAAITRKYGCGIVSEEFSLASMARELNALTADEIGRMKGKADLAAKELHDGPGIGEIRRLALALAGPGEEA